MSHASLSHASFLHLSLTCLALFSFSTLAEPEVDRISTKDLAQLVTGEQPEFPKYTTQLMNLANQNSQATRPRNVGQLSDLIQEFPGESYSEWEAWYLQQQPEAIDEATEKIYAMMVKLQEAGGQIDKKMIRAWVEDLILAKTFVGLRVQEGILRHLAAKRETTWRLARPDEESKGIDGWVGDIPISVKPDTYKGKPMLQEEIQVTIVYYSKVRGGIRIEYTLPEPTPAPQSATGAP